MVIHFCECQYQDCLFTSAILLKPHSYCFFAGYSTLSFNSLEQKIYSYRKNFVSVKKNLDLQILRSQGRIIILCRRMIILEKRILVLSPRLTLEAPISTYKINSPNWSLCISLKNELREFDKRSSKFLLGDPFINSYN